MNRDLPDRYGVEKLYRAFEFPLSPPYSPAPTFSGPQPARNLWFTRLIHILVSPEKSKYPDKGVETRQQFDYLQRQMCPEIQGFLYSRALPAADCAALLSSGKSDFLNTPA